MSRLKGNEDIESIIKFINNYNIKPENITEHLQAVQFGANQQMLKDVPTATKTKFTKTYNKLHEVEKFKKTKVKSSDEIVKFDPVLE